ncbi:hypothetical protein EDC96DRAFT_448074 [Choanephora cucurbitarum]|nr:hypothetical protein EDC96DRAFT_448074 [Choanephora cucurbitarum]
MLEDNSKYGYDHIKLNFGALCLFNEIYKKYCWASENTALKLRIPFVHARDNILFLTMKQEHEQHELENLLAQNDSQRTSLSNLVDFDIQKPSKGAGYGILLPKEKNADEIDLKHTAK